MTEFDRSAALREYNTLRQQVRELDGKLAKMEAHEGEDGTREDVDEQCALVDSIAAMRRRISELRSQIYPKS